MNVILNDPFIPDYRHVLDVVYNHRPARLPLYEHIIDPTVISRIIHRPLILEGSRYEDYEAFYARFIDFWKSMTYDAFAYEASVCDCLPGHGAIMGGKGPIQNRTDFEKYPFAELPEIFKTRYQPHFDAIRKVVPPGMKAYGGCGCGIFEVSEDLVGFESLCILQFEDPELFADLYRRIGDLYVDLWQWVISRYGDLFVFYRMGDDLGYKTSTLMAPDTIRTHIFPQYRRIIDQVHAAGKKFLLHSCGNIFSVMEDLIALGIDAKHSNEDIIAPFDTWIEKYGDRIGLFGGIDMNDLCLNDPETIFNLVLEKGKRYRQKARGYGLGSGNSIAEYVPPEGYLAMIEAVKDIRRNESSSHYLKY
jgi:uroporphyrinogen-III decarboxylase